MGDEEAPLSTSTEGSSVSMDLGEKSTDQGSHPMSTPPDQDFSPQVKRLRTPPASLSHGPPVGGRRRRLARGVGSSNSRTPGSSTAPRRLSRSDPLPEAWNCGVCTYSNSSLLPYCEMCESPRSAVLQPGMLLFATLSITGATNVPGSDLPSNFISSQKYQF